MSQHYYATRHEGKPATVLLGWDRPLGHFFLVVEYDTPEEGDESEGMVYSNLNESDPFGKSLNYYRNILVQLGIVVPESMFAETARDAAAGLGNRVAWHNREGILTEPDR